MNIVADILVAVVALQHVGFLVLEMFLWTKPKGLKTFRMTQEQANFSAPLAANMGLYNGFLAGGLVFALITTNPLESLRMKCFFLGCIIIAGIFGGASVNKRIFFVQTLPAAIALILVLTT